MDETHGVAQQQSMGELEATAEPAVPSESEILARLVAHLGQCQSQSLPLASILSALPPNLRRLAGDSDGVCKWLRGFPGLLEVSGPPGEERVMLTVGKLPTLQKAASGSEASVPVAPGPAIPGPMPVGCVSNADTSVVAPAQAEIATKVSSLAKNADVTDDDSTNPSSVQLRGLPFRSTVADIRAFLGDHVNSLSPIKDNIRLLLNQEGRPSGFARIFFVSPQAAQSCRDALHRKQMGERYVEVLANNDRSGKARNRRERAAASAASSASAASAAAVDSAPAADEPISSAAEQVLKERILQECRDHMSVAGRQHILLSMLGIALTEPARNYLRRCNLGLKHFLARFPHEFRIEGPKGCEKVVWITGAAIGGDMAALFGAMPPEATSGTWSVPEPSTPEKNGLLATPKVAASVHSHFGLATPSDWGSPGGLTSQQAGSVALGQMAGLDFSTLPGAGAWPYWVPPPWSGGPWGVPWAQQDEAAPPVAAQGNGAGHEPAAKAVPKKHAVKSGTDGGAAASTARSHAHLHPQSHPFAHRSAEDSTDVAAREEAAPDELKGSLKNGVAAVRLRGLPFSVTVQDVLAFFSQHNVAEGISEKAQAAQLLPKANGRPSGQAVVEMKTRRDAEEAQQALNHQWVGQRYIEVFVYGEEGDNDGAEGEPISNVSAATTGAVNAGLPAMAPPPPPIAAEASNAGSWPPPWATSFSQAAPWAIPWAGLSAPPVPGGPPPVLGNREGAGASGEALEPTWDSLMSMACAALPPCPPAASGPPPSLEGRKSLQV